MNLLVDYFPKELIKEKQIEICETDLELKPLLSYAYKIIKNNTKELRKEFLWQPFDCIGLVYYYNVKTIQEAKIIIKNFIMNEVRKSLNEDNDIDKINQLLWQTEKYCNSCKKLMPIDNFYKRIDYRNGMEYRESMCKSCRKERKRDQRKKYRSTPEAKAKAKVRYERWKLKNKRK